MFLSIVIPVFKVEKYLKKCVDSILKQELTDYEIILVDDGSPDGCPLICDEYGEQYEVVKVIHKENGGSSSARNTGLSLAQGQYVMFVDSDDWWNSNVKVRQILENVRNNNKIEMFLLTGLDYVQNAGYYKRKEHEKLNSIRTDSVENYYRDLLFNGNLEVHAATKIFKRDFLIENNLYFTSGILSEDNEWMIRILRCLRNVAIIEEPLYIYRTGRPGSVTNTIKTKNIYDLLWIIKQSILFYETHSSNLKELELSYCSQLWFSALGLSFQLNKEDRNDVKKAFEETKSVCQYSNSKKTKIAYAAFRLLGFNATMRLLGQYIRLKQNHQVNKIKVSV